MKQFHISLLSFVLWASIGSTASAARIPEASPPLKRENLLRPVDVLARFAAAQTNLCTFIVHSETRSDERWSRSEFRYDGVKGRSAHRHITWGRLGDRDVPEAQPSYTSHLWDGSAFFTYTRPPNRRTPGNLTIMTNRVDSRAEAAKMLRTTFVGAPLLGYFYGCTERADLELKKATRLFVREKPERIADVDCWVLEGTSRSGSFTLWIAPERGWSLAQAEMVKRAGHSFADFADPVPSNLEIRQTVRNVRLEQINGVWLGMEADIELTYRDANDPANPQKNTTGKTHHRNTAVVLNPDFSVRTPFVPDDVVSGARVNCFTGPARGQPVRQFYTWVDGNLVPEKEPPGRSRRQ